jgi:hypothetical protein
MPRPQNLTPKGNTMDYTEPQWPTVDTTDLNALRIYRVQLIGRLAAVEETMREVHGDDICTV